MSKPLILISFETTQRTLRYIKSLKNTGWDIVLIYWELKESVTYFGSGSVHPIRIHPNELVAFISRLESSCRVVSSLSADPYTYKLLEANFTDFYYDYKDLFEGLLLQKVDPRLYQSQRFCVFESLGVINKDDQLWSYVNRIGGAPKSNFLFPDACFASNLDHLRLRRLPACKTPKLCFIGNFLPEAEFPNQQGDGQLPIAKSLTAQGLEYHIFPLDAGVRHKQVFRDYLELSESVSRFHFHSNLNRHVLKRKLLAMDFGSLLVPAFHHEELLRATFLIDLPNGVEGLPTRTADYLEACLPLIVSEGINFACNLVKSFEIGIVVNGSSLKNLSVTLKDIDYLKLRRNVADFVTDIFNVSLYGIPLRDFLSADQLA